MNRQTIGVEAEKKGSSKASLDKDLKKFTKLESATRSVSRRLIAPGLSLIFLALSALFAGVELASGASGTMLAVAAVLAGYMALNIGANDVANNVGPAVGARALTMTGALIIAAIFEAAGALIAGGDVVKTISKGIIDPAYLTNSAVFINVMMASLIASAVWVNLATYIGAPVSTTHAVVGGVIGAGLAAAGFGAVNWPVMAGIAASWVISPLMGGLVAAGFLWVIKDRIVYQTDKIAAARLWVPLLLAVMSSAFAAYLTLKGLSHVWKPSPLTLIAGSMVVFAGSFAVLKPIIHRQSEGLANRNQSLRTMFNLPLICSAALLSFAHGANDVANAVGPLAGILHAAENGTVSGNVQLPVWIMAIGAIGISLGLFLFGPRLIRTVGEQITRMNPMRAFCVALSAAITVLVASALGLPVSSTHIAVGAVFGVGFFREWYIARSARRRAYLAQLGRHNETSLVLPDAQEMVRRKLVRRSHFTVIIAAWIITVPAAGSVAAAIYLLLARIAV